MVQEILLKFHGPWQSGLNSSKTVDSEAMLPSIEANLTNNTQRISGGLGISLKYGSSLSQPWQKHPDLLNYAL